MPLSGLSVVGVLMLILAVGWLVPRVRRFTVLLATVGFVLNGLLFLLAGFLGDLSGQHRVMPEALVLGAASIGVAVWLARWLRRDGRSRGAAGTA